MASTYLTRTQTAGTDRKKFTLSMWFKTSVPSTMSGLWCTEGGWNDGTGMACVLRHDDGSSIMTIYNPSEGGTGGNYNSTTQAFRDCNGWYHFVFAGDTTQSTQADRLKIYVNGEQISYATNNLPAQDVFWNDLNSNNKTFTIGAGSGSGHYCFEGSMSHVHLIDGTAYDASAFGETDATTGEWEAKTSPSVTYGNNGFFILKDGNTITDQSSNSNDFTLGGGTLTDLKDNPDNVFATLNPLDTSRGLSNGNTTYAGASGGTVVKGTLAVNSGKYYAECKIVDAGENMIGVLDIGQAPTTNYVGHSSVGWGIYTGDGNLYHNSSASSYSSAFSDNDIMGIALDMDNNKLYFSKNGVWQNSGVPTSGSTGTGAISITSGLTMTFCGGRDHANDTASFNFGNGYFGTTAVSSAGTNASDNGIFEYDVPTGYTALSTKGLNL